jgi:branched-chain amino acid transport system ATP-binding protein
LGSSWEGEVARELSTVTDGPLLSVRDLHVVYGGVVRALSGVTLEVGRGQMVAVLGANGAGKTTLLRAVTGLLGHHASRVVGGEIRLAGALVNGAPPAAIVRRGVAQVMEGRRILAELTVEENLRAGGYLVRDRRLLRERIKAIHDRFPVLADRRTIQAGYLSGGEQQMLAIGRALMTEPQLLILDEPSLGLAPLMVAQIRDVLTEIHQQGTAILLVEQNAAMALAIADRAYVLENGMIARDDDAATLRNDDDIRALYLGLGASGTRRSYRVAFAGRQAAKAAETDTSVLVAGGGSTGEELIDGR